MEEKQKVAIIITSFGVLRERVKYGPQERNNQYGVGVIIHNTREREIRSSKEKIQPPFSH